MFNLVAPYLYLLPTIYLFMADITNTDLFVCGCRTWMCSTSPAFVRSSASHTAGPHGRFAQKRSIGNSLVGAGGFDTISTAVCKRRESSTTCGMCHLETENVCHLITTLFVTDKLYLTFDN